jgi:hypothetical protein
MGIGVVTHPDIDWRFVSGDVHTVPVGYGPDREPCVVMDSLVFDHLAAEECIAHTRKALEGLKTSAKVRDGGVRNLDVFVAELVLRRKIPRARERLSVRNV